jgi:hypothetical protein
MTSAILFFDNLRPVEKFTSFHSESALMTEYNVAIHNAEVVLSEKVSGPTTTQQLLCRHSVLHRAGSDRKSHNANEARSRV